MATGYPVMLNLEGRGCVVVGGGEVASRKVAGLLAAGAWVRVISPMLHPDLEQLAAENAITVRRMAYAPGSLFDLHLVLVFAATDSPALNQRIAEEARALGALVEVVDAGADSDFQNMATIQRGPITIGISTGGASPALASHLRVRLEKSIGEEYAVLAKWLEQARPLVRSRVPVSADRAALWHRILDSTILDELRRGDTITARKNFETFVREALK
ncbi:MAG: bifunctional precorrin-2 dehydrogenase/sirohydrochlorin ferrochelatase [Chloroflexota bacterium]